MYVCIYIYISLSLYIYIYIYIYMHTLFSPQTTNIHRNTSCILISPHIGLDRSRSNSSTSKHILCLNRIGSIYHGGFYFELCDNKHLSVASKLSMEAEGVNTALSTISLNLNLRFPCFRNNLFRGCNDKSRNLHMTPNL